MTPEAETSSALAVAEPDTSTPAPAPIAKIGDLVRLIVHSAGTVRAAWGYVTGVSVRGDDDLKGANGEPFLSVIFLDKLDIHALSSASWPDAFRHFGPVFHESAQAAQAGVTYTDVIPGDASLAVDLPEVTLPSTAVAAAAEVQRKEQQGVGRGPVADKDIAYQSATATGVAGKEALEQGARPVVVEDAAPEWPPKGAKLGVALKPGEAPPVVDPAVHLPKVDEVEVQRAVAGAPKLHSAAQDLVKSTPAK